MDLPTIIFREIMPESQFEIIRGSDGLLNQCETIGVKVRTAYSLYGLAINLTERVPTEWDWGWELLDYSDYLDAPDPPVRPGDPGEAVTVAGDVNATYEWRRVPVAWQEVDRRQDEAWLRQVAASTRKALLDAVSFDTA